MYHAPSEDNEMMMQLMNMLLESHQNLAPTPAPPAPAPALPALAPVPPAPAPDHSAKVLQRAFHVICVFATAGMVGFWIYKFELDKDIASMSYKEYFDTFTAYNPFF